MNIGIKNWVLICLSVCVAPRCASTLVPASPCTSVAFSVGCCFVPSCLASGHGPRQQGQSLWNTYRSQGLRAGPH